MQEGSSIVVNDMHSLNKESWIIVIKGGIFICANDEQQQNANFSIEVTKRGISILFNNLHS